MSRAITSRKTASRGDDRRIQEAKRELAALITDDLIDKAIERLEDCMTATRRVRSDAPRKPGEPIQYETVQDYPIQLAAIKTAFEFRYGKPKQQIQMSTDDEAGRRKGRDEVMQALAADWERTKRIGDSWLSGIKEAKNPEVIDVEPLVEIDV